MTTWTEWRKTVSQRLLEVIVHREYAAEADQRNDEKKVSTQPLALNSGRTGANLKEEEEEALCDTFATLWEPTILKILSSRHHF